MVTLTERGLMPQSEFDPRNPEQRIDNIFNLIRLRNLVSFVYGADIEFFFRKEGDPRILSIQNFPSRTDEERLRLNDIIPGTYASSMVTLKILDKESPAATTYLFFSRGQVAKEVSTSEKTSKIVPLKQDDYDAVHKNLVSLERGEFKLKF